MNADEVKAIRKQARLTQEEFARILGVTPKTVNNWERGKNIPESKHESIQAIAGTDSPGNNFAAGRDIHHINTSVEKVLECLNAQQAMTAEALAQNSKLIQIIDKLTNQE